MSKYKIEIEIDVDFDKIFSEIPEGLFSAEGSGSDEHYEKDCIYDILKDAHCVAIERYHVNQLKDKKMAPYHKHHDACSLEAAKQMWKNVKVTKIENE